LKSIDQIDLDDYLSDKAIEKAFAKAEKDSNDADKNV